MSDNFFKWNSNDFNNTSDQKNDKFNFDMIPDDQEDDFQNIIMNKSNNNSSSNNNFGSSLFGNTINNQSFNNINTNNNINNNNNEYTMNFDNNNNNFTIINNNNNNRDFEMDQNDLQQQEHNQIEMEEGEGQGEETNEFDQIFNDKSTSDDIIYHNTLEYEFVIQPSSNIPELAPILLSNKFLKLSQAKINSINNDDNNKAYYITTNRKQKENQLKNYQFEKDTWSVINKLYEYRDIQRELDIKERIELLHPSQTVAYNFYIKKDPELREYSIILQWLEEMSSTVEFNEDQVQWTHTLNQLKKKRSNISLYATGAGGEKTSSLNLVNELDPDSVSRQNKSIDKIDETNENKFLQSLWSFLRAGDRNGAAEYCSAVGQFWRAQSLIGLNHYDGELDIGNPFFNLWKSNCLSISKNSSNQYERAIYGLLSGNLDAILPIQKNWYDYFWCYLRVLYDEKLFNLIKPYLSPLSLDEDIDLPSSIVTSGNGGIGSGSNVGTCNEILEILKTNSNQIEIKSQSDNPYHVIQEFIIKDDYLKLFETLPGLLRINKTPEFNRFAVLLILFFRKREAYIPISTSKYCSENVVINEYVEYLIGTQQYELVALYTSLLNNESYQVEVYSKFLVDIIDNDSRQQCLGLAEKFGLNTQEIAQSVVKNIASGSMVVQSTIGNVLSNQHHHGYNNSSSSDIITPEDLAKIDSIKWLCFDKQLLIKAILQSNILIREFIKSDKYSVSIELLKSLPKDIVSIAKQQSPLIETDTNNIIKEFKDWENFLTANTRINLWLQNYSNKPKDSSSTSGGSGNYGKKESLQLSYAERLDIERKKKDYLDSFGQWNQNNINYGKEAKDSIHSVLKTGWLCPLENQLGIFSNDDENGSDVTALRKKCIPLLFQSLFNILVGMGSIQKSCELVNQISDERLRWYSVFSKKQLIDIMQLIRESSIKLL